VKRGNRQGTGTRRPRRSSASLSPLLGSEHPHRILVAEDDETFLDALEAVLQADGAFVVVGRAHNGQEALDLAEELQPDLVVMDIEMPVLDGVEATRILQERMPDLPVLAISGHDYEERVLDIRSAGAADYVRKARLEDELPAVAAALVRQRSRA
jgi:DNA-binding NarL/FixJ family response regulator